MRHGEPLDALLQQGSGHTRWNTTQDNEEKLIPALRRHLDPILSEVDDDGDQRSDVQSDIKRLAGVGPPQQPGKENEMRRAADGDELGESLNDAQDNGLNDGHG
jgi:hypothetical protein